MKFSISLLTVLSLLTAPAWAQTTSMREEEAGSASGREFIMSCTYGVLAGSLVGIASLAFVDKPSDNLQRVARGASLGLYTGILLGLYVVYVVPYFEGDGSDQDPVARLEQSSWMVSPMFEQNQIDGLKADVTVLRW